MLDTYKHEILSSHSMLGQLCSLSTDIIEDYLTRLQGSGKLIDTMANVSIFGGNF